MLYLSGAAPQGSVKALRAALYSPKMNCAMQMEWDPDNQTLGMYGVPAGCRFERGIHGYDCFTHNLGYNTYHIVCVSRRPGFMTTVDDEAIYQQLCDPRYTTPVIREWAGWIGKEMLSRELIVRAGSFGCKCAYMVADDKQLDGIVQRGLRSGKLMIV